MIPLLAPARPESRSNAAKHRSILALCCLAVIFISLHVAGVHIPYHQDEYKWQMYANPAIFAPGSVPHPPLTELIYRVVGHAIGYDNFRLIPFAFGFANLFLIFELVRRMHGRQAALWSAALFTFSFFSLLASLMVDTDGAIMPFFLLLAAVAYYRLRDMDFSVRAEGWPWWALFTGASLAGFMVKVSFILAIAAFAIDCARIRGAFDDTYRFLRFLGYGLLLVAGLAASLLIAKLLFPFFPLAGSIAYWEHFSNVSDILHRGWLQTFIQTAKAVMYLSPLLVLAPLFVSKDDARRASPFLIFIGLGLIFYVVLFDFSLGALDRYYEYLIVPLIVLTSAALSRRVTSRPSARVAFLIIIGAAALCALQLLPHSTPPLYPKTEWIGRIVHGNWNFLFPFMGGSGPIPMYVSFLMIALSWIVAAILSLVGITRPSFRKMALYGLIGIGLVYNGSFVEEYLFGRINGSSAHLASEVARYIAAQSSIQAVTVYNDNGAYEVMKTGTYDHRLYVDPKFDIGEKIRYLNSHKEYYSVIDIPHLDPSTVYARYFASCVPAFATRSGVITATVYDCRQAPDVQR